MSNKSQNDQILEHLQEKGSITSLEAIECYGVTRLSGRIYDLKRNGWKINSEMVSVPTRNGGTARVARYTLEKPQVSDSPVGAPLDLISFVEHFFAFGRVTR